MGTPSDNIGKTLTQREKIARILLRDKRYSLEAYEFMANAVPVVAQKLASKQGGQRVSRHVTGQELTLALRDMLLRDYGPMAVDVLAHWGIFETSDFGNIVYNLVAVAILSTSPQDSRADFDHVFDFQTAFVAPYKSSSRSIRPLPEIDLP